MEEGFRMSDAYKTFSQLRRELDAMRTKLQEIATCRLDLDRVKTRYEKLLDAAPDALIFVKKDFSIIMVNAQTETLFGYIEDELIGQNLEILIPERFRERHHRYTEQYFADPHPRGMGSDLRIFGLRKDGAEFRADISLSPLQTDEGLIVIAALRDVTERTEAQEQIERNFHIQRVISSVLKMSLGEGTLEEMLNTTLSLILSVPHLALRSSGSVYLVEGDPARLVLKAHQGMGEEQVRECSNVAMGQCLCGRAASSCEVIFADCVDNRHEIRFQDAAPHGHYCVPMVSAGRPLGIINVLVSEGHERSPLEEEFLLAVANALAMVVGRHLMEQEKKRLQAELAQSQKFAALGRITANVAHELRNPLTAVGGFARRLSKGISAGMDGKETAELIVSEVAELERILRSVLAFSREAALQLRPEKLDGLVEEVLQAYGGSCAEKNIRVSTSIEQVPDVRIDREQVREAMGCLVSNAVDAAPHGGEIRISVSAETLDHRKYATIQVSDNGDGVSPGIMDKLFEPFFTTKIAQKGIGLGLPIAKKIAEEHGGFVAIRNNPDRGATAILYLPV